MAEVIVKIIRSDNKVFVLGDDWRIPSNGLDGFGVIENDISKTDNAIGDGANITSSKVSDKDRTVKAFYNGKDKQQVRHLAVAFFNPKKTYKLYLTYMGLTRWCEGRLYKFSLPTANVYAPLELQFTLLCPQPYLRSHDDFGNDIASVTPMVAFPYLSAYAGQNYIIGRATGRFNFSQELILSNDGDVDTACRAVFRAKGPVSNPKLVINGNYVRVIASMKNGDELTIDFTQSPPTVRLNGVNAIGMADRSSSFNNMDLVIGDSIIKFDADAGSDLLEVSVYYNKLYAMI